MIIKRYDYPGQFPDIDSLMQRLRSMLLEGHYVLSREVDEFELALALNLSAAHAVGLNCGTDALLLALRVAKIGPGDEVITQANTFHATVSAILWSGATPILVDATPETFGMDTDQLKSAYSERTRAIIPVHLYGKPAPMQAVLDFADQHNLIVIEDAAQAIGATYRGKKVGTIGQFGALSFHPSKNLAAAGDGGALLCQSATHAEELRVLRSLGQSGQNIHKRVGLNTKLDAIQAVILTSKIPFLDRWNEIRREIASAYRLGLAGLPIQVQALAEDEQHVFHLFQVATPQRDKLLEALRKDGVDAVVRYPFPIHLQPAFGNCGWRAGQFPVSERLARQLLALPVRPGMGPDEIAFVCDSVRRFFGTS